MAEIKVKRSSVSGKVPLTTDLVLGELAINTFDGKVYTKKNNGTESVVEIGGGGGTGDVTLAGTQTLTNKTIAFADNTLTGVQPALVSGTSIKTVNGTSLLGSGDLAISGGGSSALTISNKTGAYTVVAGDLGTIINCTNNTFTVSLTAAATLGSGFNCWVWNTSTSNSDAITVDPNNTETIDGLSTLILRRGEGMQIVCDGTNWQTGDKKTMRGYAENQAANGTRPVATGLGSTAIGYGYGLTSPSTASGTLTFAIHGATASSNYSFAAGINSSQQGAVATGGSGAMALGGSYASGTDSFAAATQSNTSSYGAKGANSVAMGKTTLASGTSSISFGEIAQATGDYSLAMGYGCIASATASQAYGFRAKSDVVGKIAYAIGTFGTAGDAQQGVFILRTATTNATPTGLSTNGAAPAATTQINLPSNSAYAFTGIVVARRQAAGGTESAAWKVEGLIRREGTAATTVLVNSNMTVLDNQPGWTLALTADTTNGGLAVTATGAAATNIRWVATMQTSEVTYA